MAVGIPNSLIKAIDVTVQGESAFLAGIRAAAKEKFLANGLPSRRDEDWKYTSLKSISGPDFKQSALEATVAPEELGRIISEEDIAIVFVDGILSAALSNLSALPSGVTICSLSDSDSVKGADTKSLTSMISANDYDGDHCFAQLNRAMLSHGVVIDVAEGVVLERPLHLAHFITHAENLSAPRHVVRAAKNSLVQIIESHVPTDNLASLTIAAVDVAVATGATVRHIRLQNAGDVGIQIGVVKAKVEQGGCYDTFGFAQGGSLIRNDVWIDLAGENAETKVDGLYLANGSSIIDSHTTIDHNTPKATSRQLYKGVIDGSARGVFNGKIIVRQDAQQTQAFQSNKNLLRSSKAEIDTKPELQIDADDVKCAHGATIGMLDENEIFYLQSRGINRENAEAMLSQAFADDVIMRIEDENIRGRVRAHAVKYFSGNKIAG